MFSGLIRRALLLLVLIATASLTQSATAQELGPATRDSHGSLFLAVCEEKNRKSERLRVCERMVLSSAGKYREAVLFLRSRVNDLIVGTDSNAATARYWFHWSSVITVVVATIAALLGILTNAFASQVQKVLFVLVGFLPLIIATFGWKEQLQAELLAWENLSNLRDRIDLGIAATAGSGDEVTKEQLQAWATRLDEVVQAHADAYSGSFSVFSPAQILGSPAD